jgi:hypothetical protein
MLPGCIIAKNKDLTPSPAHIREFRPMAEFSKVHLQSVEIIYYPQGMMISI